MTGTGRRPEASGTGRQERTTDPRRLPETTGPGRLPETLGAGWAGTAVRIMSWVSGVGLLLIGVASWLIRPPYGVSLTATDSLAEINAVIVGLHLGIGGTILVLAGCRLHLVGVLLGTLSVAGLAAVRITEMLLGEDAATTRQWILLAPELAGLVLGAVLLVPRLPQLGALSAAAAQVERAAAGREANTGEAADRGPATDTVR
ncbi:hypothetical protein V1634_25700 [Plantactinospora veratri]|uniref:DUF4345 domain-containing protein n=1 Tax=Plantactinospora veratri TaxID=1436122 RepID=A0ABU7SJX4_9ACTN